MPRLKYRKAPHALTPVVKTVTGGVPADDRTDQLAKALIEAINLAGWPVGRIDRIYSAGESGYGCDLAHWITPGGVAMTAWISRGVQNASGDLGLLIDELTEGWA
jgi:hypothetical protein